MLISSNNNAVVGRKRLSKNRDAMRVATNALLYFEWRGSSNPPTETMHALAIGSNALRAATGNTTNTDVTFATRRVSYSLLILVNTITASRKGVTEWEQMIYLEENRIAFR